jgi:exosome complex component RRP4
MSQLEREIVIPGQYLGDCNKNKSGKGTFIEQGKIFSQIIGILQKKDQLLSVIPLKGKYDAITGDTVIGIVLEPMSSSWLIDINAPYPALLHVNEVPWKVDFNETDKYLNTGDSVLAKVLSVDFEKKLQVTLKDRNLFKINRGFIIEVEPAKIPRIIGKKGSMIQLLKKHTRCRLFVGKNGRIWIEGNQEGIAKTMHAIKLIERESISFGLTDKIEDFLKNSSKSKDVK